MRFKSRELRQAKYSGKAQLCLSAISNLTYSALRLTKFLGLYCRAEANRSGAVGIANKAEDEVARNEAKPPITARESEQNKPISTSKLNLRLNWHA